MKGFKIRAFLATLCIMSATLSGQPVKATSTSDLQSGHIKAPEPEVLVLDDNMDENIDVSSDYLKSRDHSVDRLKMDNLPAKYDSRALGRVTSVKDQDPYGTCWSFAMMATLESSLISSGLYQNDLDLSELHLVKYACQSVEDPLGGTKGDQVCYRYNDKYDAGHDVPVAYHILANWIGAVPEAYMKYPGNAADLSKVSQEEAYNADIIHLQDMYTLDYYDYDVIKSAIMKYGAVAAACVMDEDFVNQQNGAYYYPYSGYANHAITIVGWDDNYSHTNFNNDPGVDGAWLVKNSYGQIFGDNGYMWVSYNDMGMEEVCYVLLAEKADNYDLNYQYDGSYMDCHVKGYEGVKASNVFKVAGSNNKKQALKAVSFALGTAMTDYEIQIYKNPTDPKNPESGTPLLSTPASGFAEFKGYYTVKLPEEVILKPNDSFAVVITYHGDGKIYIAAETTKSWGGYEFVASAEPNTSLVYFPRKESWQDIGEHDNLNLRIKAFTCIVDDDGSDTERIPFKDVAETDWEYPYVCDVYEQNIMVGLSNEEFGKNRNLTRAEFVTVLYNMSGRPQLDYEALFTDVPSGKWYSIPVVWAKQNGVTAGYGDKFGVADKITREQIVRMMYSFSGDAAKETKPNVENLDKFADADKISSWAKEAVAWSIENNVIAGKPLEAGKLFMDPQGYATRGECATIISKYLAARNANK